MFNIKHIITIIMKYKCIGSFTSERGKKYHITDIISSSEYDELSEEEQKNFLEKPPNYSPPKSWEDIKL